MLLFTAATIYICNGFVSGIANFINWTASLAFIPWVLYFFFSILQKPTYQKSIALGVASWLMLVCGYPAFIVYTTYCLMAIVLFFFIKAIQQKELNIVLKKIGFLLLGLCIALLLSLPALMAYIEFLPFYNRGKDLATDLPFRDCFYPQFLSSLFIPSSVYSKTYDLLCHSANRDIYFGVLPLITVVLFAGKLKKIRTPFIILLTSIAIFTFVFLFGFLTPLGNFSFNYLPLMGSFKWSAAARVFSRPSSPSPCRWPSSRRRRLIHPRSAGAAAGSSAACDTSTNLTRSWIASCREWASEFAPPRAPAR